MKTEVLSKEVMLRIASLWMVVFAVGLFISSAELRAQEAQATVEVGLATIPENTTGTVKVSISGSPAALSDFQGRFTFDPTVVNVREVTGLNGYTIAAFQMDNFEGEVRFIGFKASGTLITEGDFLQFTLIAVGATGDAATLGMEFITLNSEGGPIPHSVRLGRLTIGLRQEIDVDFSWTPTNPQAGQEIQFSDLTSAGGGGSFTRWNWDFGDSETSTVQNPKHRYAQKGSYTVILTIEDNQGNTSAGQKQVVIRGQGEPITVPIHNFPNPASSGTTFSYQLPQGTSQALLTVYAFTGPLVLTQKLNADSSQFEWGLKDQAGQDLPNGAYYYRIWASTREGAVLSVVGKLVIIRS